jgi:hypothetical protein
MTDKQKTITPEHIYKTLKEMDFEDFIPILKRSEASKKRVFEFFDNCLFRRE